MTAAETLGDAISQLTFQPAISLENLTIVPLMSATERDAGYLTLGMTNPVIPRPYDWTHRTANAQYPVRHVTTNRCDRDASTEGEFAAARGALVSVSFRSVSLPENVAGRLYFHSMPGRYEPLQAVWNELAARGVNCIACLAPMGEIERKSPDYGRALRDGSVPCPVKSFAIPDYSAPEDETAFWTFAAGTRR